ncbi:MAG: hypothetical protein ACFFD4_13130 [Candidatus Odinarchaeota archaeon]
MEYKELVEIWRQELGSDELLNLPSDFFLSWEAAIAKHRTGIDKTSSDPVQVDLAAEICNRMTYLLGDLKTARKVKILTAKLNGSYMDSSLLTEEEKKFYRAFSILEEEVYGSIQGGKAYKREIKSIKQVSSESGVAEETPVVSSSKLVVGIIQDIPDFIGIDKRIHGPFRAGDVASLPEMHALSLIKKGMAFLIETG